MRFLFSLTLSIAAFIFLLPSASHAIELGDPAPPLKVDRWVKGQENQPEFGKGTNIFVLLFWETWCNSCMSSLPQIIELHKQTKDKGIVFLSVCAEPATNILDFLKQNEAARAIEFPVAADQQRQSFELYMNGFSQSSVPRTFIIDRAGRIVWYGHPLAGLAGTLEAISNGSFDLESEKKVSAADRLQKRYFELVQLGTNVTLAAEIGRQIVRDGKKNPWLLNNFSWKILTDPTFGVRDVDLAVRASQLAYETATRTNGSFADTYARALFTSGRTTEAIAMQKKAISLSPAERRSELEKALGTYEAAAKKKSAPEN